MEVEFMALSALLEFQVTISHSDRLTHLLNGRQQHPDQNRDNCNHHEPWWTVMSKTAGAGYDGSITQSHRIAPGKMHTSDGIAAHVPDGHADEQIAIGGLEDHHALASQRSFIIGGRQINLAVRLKFAQVR